MKVAKFGLVTFYLLVGMFPSARAQSTAPIAHARIGNNTEGATVISAGPFAEQVALIDGYDVIAVPVNERWRAPQRLLDLKALQPIGNLSGIVYVPSERAYLLNDNGQPDTLLAADEQGRPLSPRPITYPPEIPFVFEAEGMTYLPPGSSFPDRIARIAIVPPFGTQDIQIMTRAGVVEREIPLPSPLDFSVYLPGLAYDRFSDSFLLSGEPVLADSAGPGELWKVSMDGAVISGPIKVPGEVALSLEALVEFRDGRVFTADYAAGKLLAFNRDLTPNPSEERVFRIGLGISRPAFGVYDPRAGRYALGGVVGVGVFLREGVAEVSPSLDWGTRLFGFDGTFEPRRGLAYVPEDDAFAEGRLFSPLGIDIFRRNGSLLDRIEFTTIVGLPSGTPSGLAYIPRTRQFALTMFQFPNQVFLFSRSRTYDGSFTVDAVPSSLQYASQSGQDRLLVWTPPSLLTYDLFGNLLSTRQLPTKGMVHPDAFIAGPGEGFALFDPNDSEFVVYSPRR